MVDLLFGLRRRCTTREGGERDLVGLGMFNGEDSSHSLVLALLGYEGAGKCSFRREI